MKLKKPKDGQKAILGAVELEDEEDAELYHFEPLPFADYGLFNQTYADNCMKISVNPCAQKKLNFIPNKPVSIVEITAEKKSLTHVIHPYIYTIKLKHDKYTWQVTQHYKKMKDVHKALSKLVKAELGISCSQIPKKDIKPDWPLFPMKSDTLVHEDKIETRCRNLALYFEKVLTYPPYREHEEVAKLLGVSPLSFVTDAGQSLFEGTMFKNSGEGTQYGCFRKTRNLCEVLKICDEKRWFCLKDTYLAYLNPYYNNSLGFIMLVDRAFECKTKSRFTHSIVIKNEQRSLVLKCKNAHQQKEWYERIQHMLNETGKHFHRDELLPYGSYAPRRANQLCKWYVNASQYMEHVMSALNNAREEIYIADWWLCPELFLKRPTDDLQFRLDKILLKKAKEGVKVYILLYKEITVALNLMSLRTRQILTQYGVNTNIKVLRHPDHFFNGVFMWSHHEKFVVIDQSIGFLGGIDLCFGRWDDDSHRLVDLGAIQNTTEIDIPHYDSKLNVSQSDSNLSTIRHLDPMKYLNKNPSSQTQLSTKPSTITKATQEKSSSNMSTNSSETHDMNIVRAFTASKKSYQNPTVASLNNQSTMKASTNQLKNKIKDLKVKSKNNLNKMSNYSKQIRRVTSTRKTDNNLSNSDLRKEKENGVRRRQVHWVTSKKEMIQNRQISITSMFKPMNYLGPRTNIEDDIYDRWHGNGNKVGNYSDEKEDSQELAKNNGFYYWIGKDYANAYQEDFKDIENYWKDQFDRTQVPRMPWRDQGMCLIGESARDLARHFIQRWNQCKNEQVPLLETYPYLLPKCYNEPFTFSYRDWFKEDLFKCDIQMIRSVDDWSAGITKTETSILNAYCQLIQQAEHYIYIENQFFITTTNGLKDNQVKNEIGLAIAEKIKTAFENKKSFKVYVVVPLLPGFDRINAIKAVQYYNLRSINLGEYSIYSYLKKAGINDPSEYITFHGMRNWSVLMGKLVQEIIYVHSKLMIVDDKYVICGSANINDRSLLGKRDSEIAAVIRDEEFLESTLNGQKVKVGKYAFSLRNKIFRLHMGLSSNSSALTNITDCASDDFFNSFRLISHQNTLIYDEVFKCLPSDNILNFDDLKNYTKLPSLKKSNPVEAKVKLEKLVMGLVVDFPLEFLSKEKNFFPDYVTPEGIVPTEMWT